MKVSQCVALVTGGASGLGEAVVRRLANSGARAAVLDLDEEKGAALAEKLGGAAIFLKTDVTDEESVKAAVEAALERLGRINLLVNCAGIAPAAKVLGRGGPHSLDLFVKVIQVNLVGTFNVIRLAVEKMAANPPGEDGERGVIINTASTAAFEGQIGQAAYSASKGGVVSLTLPLARELASLGIRVVTIAPGIMETPMLLGMPEMVRESLGKAVPFPQRLGKPEEFAMLVEQIVENTLLNGACLRLDGALRMQAR
ncbi:MAG TPA: 3-hydroxyacyl-CoA dehydrogenase [Bacillota bacterium]|jgi:NAD(P)-dependent dehydrogenase (short-subunit alcohol dehydrogenase family)|nr:3-hydroxyacyl-CoA dehydrogenase [Bacillota bacterium]HOB86251.1 3-hydroxyacyl-CoA dehydrogenase [Bacillota bacterium]HOP68799.1 3-hydroxyacyl-CoA dehydrogenase [Bacillota bacterium]HPT33834.1 3-hydroxyacyl-CoA dehydrogenase [Bacillota bacterium]HQD06466.1 3-hydroxyacyl-CoA dehydrogenase [Bacillota bacterium]